MYARVAISSVPITSEKAPNFVKSKMCVGDRVEKRCVCLEIRGCNGRATRSQGKQTQLYRGGPSKLEMCPSILGDAFGGRPGKRKR